jgi:hypothetical protein
MELNEPVEVELVDVLSIILEELHSSHVLLHQRLCCGSGSQSRVVVPHGGDSWVWASRGSLTLVCGGTFLLLAAESSDSSSSWDL